MEVKCIVAIVERGKADKIVEKAKKAGAKGATIIYGRGTGQSEALKFFNLRIEASKEIILILSDINEYMPIYEAIAVSYTHLHSFTGCTLFNNPCAR